MWDRLIIALLLALAYAIAGEFALWWLLDLWEV